LVPLSEAGHSTLLAKADLPDWPLCLEWVKSGHGVEAWSTSSVPPKSDIVGMRIVAVLCQTGVQ
jgi:hypothetical protein